MKFIVPITQTIQIIPIVFAACCDLGIMRVAKFDPKDGAAIYGIQAEVFDLKGNSMYDSRVYESYSPPAAESTVVILMPGAAYVRCEIFGPDLDGKWDDASFEIVLAKPTLHIAVEEGNAIVTWDPPCPCWVLERMIDGWWMPSDPVVPIDGRATFFRLRRS